ncbi:unnamed protein product, partial [Prorocentrum cordatum]
MVDAVARLDDNEDKRHLMRPSELKQMELMKYQEQCSEIVPKQVYISSYVVACNLAILQRHEITHILNLAADVCESRFQDKFKYATYYCKDVSSEDISMLFYRTLEWMQVAKPRCWCIAERGSAGPRRWSSRTSCGPTTCLSRRRTRSSDECGRFVIPIQ